MTAEQNKELVRRLVEEAVNRGNPDVLDEVAMGEFARAARRWVGPYRPTGVPGARVPGCHGSHGRQDASPIADDQVSPQLLGR